MWGFIWNRDSGTNIKVLWAQYLPSSKGKKADSETNFSRPLNHGHPSILNNSENPADIFLWK